MMPTKTLTCGATLLFSEEDRNLVESRSWQVDTSGYACAQIRAGGSRTTHRLHRLIARPPPTLNVDHINGNRLDCRRENLRICTAQENARNRKQTKGWYKTRNKGRWAAYIDIPKRLHLGTFPSEEEAKKAASSARARFFGEFAPSVISTQG